VVVLENVRGLGRVRGEVTKALRRCGNYMIAWLSIQPLMLATPFRRGRWYLCMVHELES
jgi:site-specific DNA-cytosine methylase